MRGIIRLIDGLIQGDERAVYILIFAVVGTAVIFIASEIVQRRRKRKPDR